MLPHTVDGKDFKILFTGIDTRKPLWALIDLYGKCTSIKLATQVNDGKMAKSQDIQCSKPNEQSSNQMIEQSKPTAPRVETSDQPMPTAPTAETQNSPISISKPD